MGQARRVFFGPTDPWHATQPSEQARWLRVDAKNPDSPFNKFVGNELALKKVQAAAFKALSDPHHVMHDFGFAFFGPASAGKTMLARLYGEVVQLPFLELSPKSVKTLDAIYKEIHSLVPLNGEKHHTVPPMVIFLDEIHAWPDSIIQGLLKATEHNDGIMITESGRKLDCKFVTWMIATTDEGKLFDAFRTRFSPVVLKYLDKESLSRIVQSNNPDWPLNICRLVSHYNSRIPRKALEFARYMRLVKGMSPNKDWTEIASQVARDEGIDEYGMQDVHLRILTALGEGPIARNRISLVAGRKDEETERFIMPWLLTATDDQPALVDVSSKGYTITEAGIAELDKRKILHS